MNRIALLLLVAGFLVGCEKQSPAVDGFQTRSVTVNGKSYGYRVFVPEHRDQNSRTPVMLYLHGSGVRGDDNVQQADAFSKTIARVREKIDFIVVLPQCRENTFWASTEMADQALAALDQAVTEFGGDPERIYLAGYSLGGYGVWQIAAANPKKFAALIPIAGGFVGERPIAQRDRDLIIPSVGKMLDSEDPYATLATAIGSTPAWLFHGAKDESVPAEFSRKIVKALEDNGSQNVKYTEDLDDGHAIVERSFSETGLFEWLAGQKVTRAR